MFKPLSSNKFSIKIKNYNSIIKNKCQKDRLAPIQPSRILIIGKTGSGKTNLLLNMIYDRLCWTRIYVNAKDLSEQKYVNLKEVLEAYQHKNKKKPLEQFYYFNSEPENIVTVDQLDNNHNNLIVFDDFVSDRHAVEHINDLFIRGRKKNATIVYLSQSFYHVPKIIRLQCDYLIFFKINDSREIANIHQNYDLDLSKDKFVKVFREATKEPYSFLMLDYLTDNDELRVRKNFDHALVLNLV